MLRINQIIVLCFFILTSCAVDKNRLDPSSNPDLVDQSWITDKQCIAPCWHSLEIGKSTKTETLKEISKFSFVESEQKIYNNTVSFLCKSPPDISCVSVEFTGDILTNIRQYINYKITVEEVADLIGPPDSFYSYRRNPEGNACDIEIFWEENQISIDIYYDGPRDVCDEIEHGKGRFPKGLSVWVVNYISPDEMKESMTKARDIYPKKLMPWIGFIK